MLTYDELERVKIGTPLRVKGRYITMNQAAAGVCGGDVGFVVHKSHDSVRLQFLAAKPNTAHASRGWLFFFR